MSKELTIRPDQAIIEVGNQIDKIVNECLPVAAQENQNFVQALTLANGIKALRQIFLNDPQIQETVEAMQNTHLGFMTDRTPAAIYKAKQGGKELKPYRYEEVAEVVIEGMLKGYRISNNEFNMLVGRFYAAKNGKFRRIQECEGVTDFQFTTTSPAYEPIQGGIQYAKVQAFASWKKDGQLATLGSSTQTEDKLIFKIRVNKMMGEDAIVGKALSKLFSRVLMRLEGKIMPEATDVSEEDIVEGEVATGSAFDLADKIKEGEQDKAGQVVDADPVSKQPSSDTEEQDPPAEDLVTDLSDRQDLPPDAKKQDEKNHEDLKAAMKKQSDLMTLGIDPAVAKIFAELTNNGDASMFWRMREKGLDMFFDEFEDKMNVWPKEIQIFVRAKCKNIAGKHPEFVERFEKAIEIAVVPPPEDVPVVVDEDDTEAWNGLYYDCPNMEGKPIAKALCKKCKEREGCHMPFVPGQAK